MFFCLLHESLAFQMASRAQLIVLLVICASLLLLSRPAVCQDAALRWGKRNGLGNTGGEVPAMRQPVLRDARRSGGEKLGSTGLRAWAVIRFMDQDEALWHS